MNGYGGVAKIVRFNWPWYVGALAATLALVPVLRGMRISGAWAALSAVATLAADFWLLASLAVSHHVYDRSGVARGEWLRSIDPLSVGNAAVFHAGQDEASAAAARMLPAAAMAVFDFFDPERNGTPSLRRARALAERKAISIAPDRIPLGEGALDLALLVFAAHEIRKEPERAAFFREVSRVLAPSGRALVVEHLRNGWNFLAYGPGAFHFLTRKAWERSFAEGGLRLVREDSLTPFVRIFELARMR